MGAYGGTAEASKTPPGWGLLADLTNDGIVDFVDYTWQVRDWLIGGNERHGDLNRDGVVDMLDVALLVDDWLNQASWYEE